MKAFLVLLLAFALFSCRPDSEAPTLILSNGKIWTGETDSSFVEAIAIRENLILQTGDTRSILSLAGPDTEVIDLQGKLVTAGFNDAHIHFLSGSMGLDQVELSSTTSLEKMLSQTLDYIRQNPDKEWITGRGWQYTFFAAGLPDHESMKALDIDRPLLIQAYDGHSAYANPKALELAGINSETQFSGFGELVKDQNGQPTGALKERAMDLVGSLVPEPTFEDKLDALRKGLAYAASLGITSVQNANGTETDLRLFQKLHDNGQLTLRYAAAFSVQEQTTDEQLHRFIFLKDSVGLANPWLRADAIKFMIDGVIEGHTGAMLEPYSDIATDDPLALGQLNFSLPRYQELVNRLDSAGLRLYTHAIGDRGVREALNAYENAQAKNGSKETRHRIEHIETIHPADIPRFAQLGVLPSMEPIHAEPGTTTVWSNAVGIERLPYSFAWRSLLDQNAPLVFSSDWPACISLNPIRGIHVAANRQNPSGYPKEGWIPAEKISVFEAMRAYTAMGAYSSFEEDKKGMLKEGYLADLVVFSQDLFSIDPKKIHETQVQMTIVDGKKVFVRKEEK
ncbi:amidohydrolase [Algoriphagus sp. H41]|uniref:Amidohydrolase n=1 Tax=Algoriphagus oliviformis TaxID=2811231 RepID=A0ABS3C2F0_9BACT|nr:amidohydrolase [Algoriphagus oliviformis]MBN7811128.1 amidohydrolase [Algoriphagus oliviformis]